MYNRDFPENSINLTRGLHLSVATSEHNDPMTEQLLKLVILKCYDLVNLVY